MVIWVAKVLHMVHAKERRKKNGSIANSKPSTRNKAIL